MIKGTKLFKCPKCGKVFRAMDIEYNATVHSNPMPCPECKTLSAPLFKDRLYRILGIITIEKDE